MKFKWNSGGNSGEIQVALRLFGEVVGAPKLMASMKAFLFYMGKLLGWLETRLAQIILDYIKLT